MHIVRSEQSQGGRCRTWSVLRSNKPQCIETQHLLLFFNTSFVLGLWQDPAPHPKMVERWVLGSVYKTVGQYSQELGTPTFHMYWTQVRVWNSWLYYTYQVHRVWWLHLRYRGNRTHAGTKPHLIRSATLTIRPTKYIRLILNVPITCDGNVRYQSYILGWSNG